MAERSDQRRLVSMLKCDYVVNVAENCSGQVLGKILERVGTAIVLGKVLVAVSSLHRPGRPRGRD
jgi:hypothetical protein